MLKLLFQNFTKFRFYKIQFEAFGHRSMPLRMFNSQRERYV